MSARRVAVNRDDIADVVALFYGRVRNHPVLGPVFATYVTDWPGHEDKIVRFWANAILSEGAYAGNPMQIHMRASDVQPEHFGCWLALFDQVLRERLPSPQRDQWSALVHRIGRGLSMGVRDLRGAGDTVPSLR